MSGATPAYRGFRLQALYVLNRIIHETDSNQLYHFEGIEDLDIYDEMETLREVVQVKSYESLVLSDMGSKKK